MCGRVSARKLNSINYLCTLAHKVKVCNHCFSLEKVSGRKRSTKTLYNYRADQIWNLFWCHVASKRKLVLCECHTLSSKVAWFALVWSLSLSVADVDKGKQLIAPVGDEKYI